MKERPTNGEENLLATLVEQKMMAFTTSDGRTLYSDGRQKCQTYEVGEVISIVDDINPSLHFPENNAAVKSVTIVGFTQDDRAIVKIGSAHEAWDLIYLKNVQNIISI